MYYRFDTTTEEGFRYAEHHDAKTQSFQKCGIVPGFCKSGHIIYIIYSHLGSKEKAS